MARTYLDKATKKMKKWADEKRRHLEFNVGDMVLVKINPSQHKMTRSLHKGLVRRYDGPFQIIKKVGKVSYKVELPPRLKIHPVFHVSVLKPFKKDQEDPSRNESTRPPFGVKANDDKKVEQVLAERLVWRPEQPSSREYLIKWKGLPDSEASWEPLESLSSFGDKIREFHEESVTRASRKRVGENVTAR